jgi:16S rRNA (adenine1518-N6/adenine1519-N6)-dimethyltransferase
MTLTEMRGILEVQGLRLTKSLGQNFLHDGNQLRRIAAAGELKPGERVLEIGPGLGPLTEQILAAGARLLAIEKDARLAHILQERLSGREGLELVEDDALAYLQREARDWSDWKLVANLPYSVASPIIVELALNPRAPVLIVATIQTEVGRRLVAKPKGDDYGVLTLLVGLRYHGELLFRIPGSCFFPPPDVESACIRLRRREVPLLTGSAERIFVPLVKTAFSQRRKMMWKLLLARWSEEFLAAAYLAGNVNRDARAEALSLDQFCAMARSLDTAASKQGPEATPPQA